VVDVRFRQEISKFEDLLVRPETEDYR